MKSSHFVILLFLLLLIGRLPSRGQTGPAQQLIISPEQIASSFGYSGKLKVQDFASLGLDKPNVIQELNFTSDDSTFLPTNVTVMTAGSLLTPQVLSAFEKAASSSPPPPNFKAVNLPDGTTAYLLSMGGPGGAGQEARMTSKDGRFDLAVSVSAAADATFEQTASNRDYYEKMLGAKADPLAALAAAIPQIYSATSSNYERIAKLKASGASASTAPTGSPQITNSSPSQTPTPTPASPIRVPKNPPNAESGTSLWTYVIVVLVIGLIVALWYRFRSKK